MAALYVFTLVLGGGFLALSVFGQELEAITDPQQRKARFDEMVAEAYERGKALSAASLFEIDDVIDPADTCAWVMAGLRSLPPLPPRTGKKRPFVDTW